MLSCILYKNMNGYHLIGGAHLLVAALQDTISNLLQLLTAAGQVLWLNPAPAEGDN